MTSENWTIAKGRQKGISNLASSTSQTNSQRLLRYHAECFNGAGVSSHGTLLINTTTFYFYCFKIARASDCFAKLKADENVCSFNCPESEETPSDEPDFFFWSVRSLCAKSLPSVSIITLTKQDKIRIRFPPAILYYPLSMTSSMVRANKSYWSNTLFLSNWGLNIPVELRNLSKY